MSEISVAADDGDEEEEDDGVICNARVEGCNEAEVAS